MGFTVNREVKDVFYLIALQGLNYVAPLLVLPYLMKVLEAEKFGYISFSLAVIQYLMLLVDFGFNFSTTKRVALAKNNKAELNVIFTSTLYAKIGLLAVSLAVLLIIALIPKFAVYRETMFIMFLMVIGNAFTFVWLFQGLGQIRFISIFNMIAKLSILPLTFLFVKDAGDYLTAAFLQSAVSIFAMIISLAYIAKHKWVKITEFIKKNIIYEIKDSYPIFLSSAATSLYSASFIIVLGYFCSAAEVGQYSAVVKVMKALSHLIFVPIAQVFYPKIVMCGAENRPEAIKLTKRIFLFVSAYMLCVFVAMFFLSPYAIDFLGESYKNTLPIFRIMAFVPIFIGMGGIVGQLGILALGNARDKKNYKNVYFIAGIIALATVFIGVPFFGSIGASVSLLITELSVCMMMFWYGRKLFLMNVSST